MRKILVLILTATLLLAMVGCQTQAPSNDTQAEITQSGEIELSADGRYPAETIKIGFVNYDTTAEQVLKIQEYVQDMQKTFNIEVVWSESLRNAEQELAFIENCAANGCQAIMGYYNEANEESEKLAEQLGMYYWGLGGKTTAYESVKMSDSYLGYVASSGGANDYDMGYSLVNMLVANDCHKIIVMSGGKDYGVQMFVNRYNGIMDGIADANASGYDIEMVYEVAGWPGTEGFAANQTAALQTDADGLAGTLSSLMWIQPMQTADKFGKVKIACIDTASATTLDMMKAGVYIGITAEPASAFGASIPMIINAITGYGANQRNADGSAPAIDGEYLVIDNLEKAEFYVGLEQTGGTWIWDEEDLKSVLGAYNPDFTVEDIAALYQAVSIEEIQERKAK